jgi:2-oxoglutarate dehydrogenase E2 component (dihydrolipoamide succinyltransferase)
MNTDIKVPVLPESVSDAVIAKWHKKSGENVRQDDPIVDIETDKVVLEVTATTSGVLGPDLIPEGTTVKAQQIIGQILAQPSSQASNTSSVTTQIEVKKEQESSSSELTENLYSPAVRKLLHQEGIQGKDVEIFSKTSKITVEDVKNYLSFKKQQSSQSAVPRIDDKKISTNLRDEERVPMSRIRQRIAQRLVQAQHTAAMLTTFNEIDMQPIMNLRAKYKDEFEKKHQIKLGFMSFFIKASCAALERFPLVNASIDENDIVYHRFCDIGVAVSTERGLVVPIIRDAHDQSLAQLESSLVGLSNKARQGALSIDELTGGTFTITNGGVFGSLLSTPIINPPQTAILGMHKIEQRAVVIDNQIVIRPMMYVALSYDHRLIDGSEAVQFLVTIKNLLQEPERLLLDL